MSVPLGKAIASARRIAKSPANRLPSLVRYGLAIILLGFVIAIRNLLPLDNEPFLLFMPAMFVIALLLGKGPGLLATFVSAFVVQRMFRLPATNPAMFQHQIFGDLVYVLISCGLVALCDMLSEALRRRDSDLLALRVANDELVESRAAIETNAAFLRSVLESSPDCIKILDLDAKLIFMSERGKEIMEVDDFSKIEGCPWPDFWENEHNISARNAVVEAKAGRVGHFQGFCHTVAGRPRWWDVVVSPILGASGAPEKLLSVSRDITGTRSLDLERARLASLIEQSSDFIGMMDVDGKAEFLNDAGMRMVGVGADAIRTTRIQDYFPAQDRDFVEGTVMPHVAETGRWEGELRLRNFASGADIPVLYTIFAIRDAMDKVLGYGTVTKDITKQKRAEAQQRLLNHELGHRLKNTLAMVQAIANQTMRRATSIAEARTAFDARLIALGKAQDILTDTKWESAAVGDIVRGALAPHGGESDRFTIEGPVVYLSSRCSLALSLAVHELATNATKYGALSNDAGRIGVRWEISQGESGPAFTLTWKETDGPVVSAPTTKGFGSFMIERSLGAYFKGTAEIDYRAEGVIFALRSPATLSQAEFDAGNAEILAEQMNLKAGRSV